ncbi:DMT family transporter [Aurantiacibacter spongiae]|uniref:DMT family transporter n=2 Tax=Aurantiacibacter spongiae TaxID=2488860 RepID=A0A3N5D186_9SPHN|nr:DMT family transporter [Aurantiacibacter spongiae]
MTCGNPRFGECLPHISNSRAFAWLNIVRETNGGQVLHRGSVLIPLLITIFAVALMSLMDAFMKGASLAVGAYSAATLRSVIGAAASAPFFLARGGRWPVRVVLRVHCIRGTVAAFMMVLFFHSLTVLPLAVAIALSFVAPIIALFLAAILLGESIGRRAISASLLGLAGTGVIVAGQLTQARLTLQTLPGLLALLASALLYAWNLVLQRQQALLAGPVEIATFQNIVVTLVLGVAAPFALTVPAWPVLADITIAAFLSVCALMLLAWAYARAEAQVLVPLEYSGLVWAALLGWLFFSEGVDPETVAGAALIVGGCWIGAPRKPPALDAIQPPMRPIRRRANRR